MIYTAANDFCDETGEPWSPRKQRRLFRQALASARQAAEELVADYHRQALAERMEQPHKLGVRRPRSTDPGPIFGHRDPGAPSFHYGRPDLPSYHPNNILPQRPYGVPTTNDHHPVYWLPTPLQDDFDD